MNLNSEALITEKLSAISVSSDDDLPPAPKDEKYYVDFSKKLLVRVRYPGDVQNVDKMLETLGGKDNLEMAVGTTKRLELRFRPDDRYSKSVTADKDQNPGILLKVKYKVPIVDPDQPSTSKIVEEPKNIVTDYEVVGLSVMNFKFNRMCDFQYLPLCPKSGNENRNAELSYIYKDILPDKLPESNDWLTNDKAKNMPFFFPPSCFSRFDTPHNLLEIDKFDSIDPIFRPELATMFRLRKQQKALKIKGKGNTSNVIIKSRQLRKGHSIFVNFDRPSVPDGPSEAAVNELKNRSYNTEYFKKLENLFKKRPIWSKAALLYLTNIPTEQMKLLLPLIAYHFQTGPWRVMWVKYGYDPRKNPEARIYQTFDFRIRDFAGLKLRVQAKRNYSSKTAQYRLGSNIKRFSLKQNIIKKDPHQNVASESSYVLRPGMIPPARQMFYQYCDIYLPEIQGMVARLPDVPSNKICDPKNGWMPNGFIDQCREIASKYICDEIQKLVLLEKTMEQQKELAKDNSNQNDDVNDLDDDDECIMIEEDENDNRSKITDENLSNVGNEGKTASEESSGSDYEDDIDMEVVEEINKFIEQTKRDM